MNWITNPELWIAFLTLCALEIVLGIDNVIFISILAGKLPGHQQDRARVLGLGLAMIMRILLLLTISWMAGLTKPWLTVFGHGLSGRDLILVVGGLFLVAKSTSEIHGKLEGDEGHGPGAAAASFSAVLVQIMLLDIVFSLDSVITAVGVVISVIFMMFFSGPISRFVEAHPTIKMLALSFLLLIGVTLIADGFGQHVSKGYIYFAMGFSVFVEMLNLKLIKKSQKPVHFHQPYLGED